MSDRKGEPMPPRFQALATYNAEVSRGIMHTPEWDEAMRQLQEDYGRWLEGVLQRQGFEVLDGGIWMRGPG